MREASDPAAPITILHVDDDPAFGDLLSAYLERENDAMTIRSVTSVSAGLDELDALDEGTVDCIVSDYDMPDTDGLEFLEIVRERFPDLPFILFTGKGSEEIASRAITAGVTDYVQKGGTEKYTILANRIVDAVEKHRVETEFQTVSRRYELVGKASTDAFYDWDFETGAVTRSDGYVQLFGYEADAIGTDIDWWKSRVHPEDRDRVMALVEDAIERGDRTFQHSYRFRLGDGSDAHIDDRGIIVYDDAGAPSRMIGTLTDITERKREKRELERTKARLELALDAAETGIWEWNRDTDAFFWDENVKRLFGIRPGSFAGTYRDFIARVHPDDREDVEATIDRATTDNGQYESEFRIERDDGEQRWVVARGRTVGGSDGESTRVVGTVTDVTNRKEPDRVIERLHGSTGRLINAESTADIADIVVQTGVDLLGLHQIGVHFVDDDREVLAPSTWSETVAERIGGPPELGPGSLAWRAFERGETISCPDLHDADRLHNVETAFRSELVVPLGGHGVTIVSSVEAGAFDRNDRRLLEILCRNATRALDRTEREKSLRETERELRRENERLAEFASLVSHDLRNPLGVAAGRLALLERETDSRHLETALRAVERMDTLITDMLTLAREGDPVGEVEPVDLSAVVENSWRSIGTENATLEVEPDIIIEADCNRVTQVVENALRNAIEHGGDGVSVRVGALADGFYIEDDGQGIPTSDRGTVFDAGVSTREGGTGFGLRIIKEIVDAHGWTISVKEGQRGGARFEITGVTRPSAG